MAIVLNANWHHGLTALGEYSALSTLFDLPQLNRDSKDGVNSQDKLAAEMSYLPIKYKLLRKSHNLTHHTLGLPSLSKKTTVTESWFFSLFFYSFSTPLLPQRALFLAKYPGTIAIITRFISAHCYTMLWVPDVQVSIHKPKNVTEFSLNAITFESRDTSVLWTFTCLFNPSFHCSDCWVLMDVIISLLRYKTSYLHSQPNSYLVVFLPFYHHWCRF